ncbi:MAG: hypothetical protein ABSH12_09625 [Endomicrobiales bacterium]
MKINRSVFHDIRQMYSWSDFQRPIAISACFFVFAVFVYVIILRPQIVGWHLARTEHVLVMKNFERYRDFGRLIKKINQQQELLITQGKNINADGAVPEKTERQFFLIINDMCDQTKIHLKTTKPMSMPDGRKAWTLTFDADFRQINLFLFLVEKKFKIESLSIVSGQPSSNHAVEITIAELFNTSAIEAANNEVIDRFTGKDLFVLYDEVGRLFSNVERRRTLLDAYSPPSRDLLLYSDTLFYTRVRPVVQKVHAPVETPHIKIDGIFWDPDVPVVVIEGRAMRLGDTINGTQILSIGQKSIVVKYHDREFTIVK